MRPITPSAMPVPLSRTVSSTPPVPWLVETRMRGSVDAGEGVDRVLEQVVQHLAQHRGIGDRSAAGSSPRRASIATPIDSYRNSTSRTTSFSSTGARVHARGVRVLGEVVDHALQRGHVRHDGARGALQHLGLGRGQLVLQLVLQALGGELDRGERVLDLVREAARDLAPGGVALRLDQVGDVVEHHDVAVVAALRQPRAAQQQRCAARRRGDTPSALPTGRVLEEAKWRSAISANGATAWHVPRPIGQLQPVERAGGHREDLARRARSSSSRSSARRT